MRKIGWLLLFVVLWHEIGAQQAEIICIETDGQEVHLEWRLTGAFAGFNGFQIKAAPDINSPVYDVGALITDINATSATISVIDNLYGVQVDCGGILSHVDFVPRGFDGAYQVDYVTVNYDNTVNPPVQSVELFWSWNLDPRLSSLICPLDGVPGLAPGSEICLIDGYRVNIDISGGSSDPLDNLYSVTETINNQSFEASLVDLAPHPQADPTLAQVSLSVNAFDHCGDHKWISPSHGTIFLESSFTGLGSCDEVIFDWQQYKGWNNQDISDYELELEMTDANDGSLSNDLISELKDSTQFHYTIPAGISQIVAHVKAINVNGYVSESNRLVLDVSAKQLPEDIYIENVTVNNGDIDLRWGFYEEQPGSLADTFIVWRGINQGNLEQIVVQPIPAGDFSGLLNFKDVLASPQTNQYTYQIELRNACGTSVQTNLAFTVHLRGQHQSGGDYLLQWTPFESDETNVTNINFEHTFTGYELFRTLSSGSTSIANLNNQSVDIQYSDNLTTLNSSNGQICYEIVTHYELEIDGNIQTFESRSNLHCTKMASRIFVPTVFSPSPAADPRVQTFKPEFLFENQSEEYVMTIFNRWGAKIFETTDVNQGWDGSFDGKDAPQGTYGYYIRMRSFNQLLLEESGYVLLLR